MNTFWLTITAALLAANNAVAAASWQGAAFESEFAKNILIDSIAVPTVAGRGRVPELAAYYAAVLKDAGFTDEDLIITPMGETVMLEATLRGRVARKPILLMGHMDVVEADPKDWTRDPFTPIEEDGFIFGRGSLDNKFEVAMLVATVARLKRSNYRPRQDVILVLTGDEETTQETTKALAAKYRHAEMVLNGDAGGGVLGGDSDGLFYQLQAAEKSYADFEIAFTNPGGHSSMPSRTNAINQLANALVRLEAHDFAPQLSELTRASISRMAATAGPELGDAMRRFIADPKDAEAVATIRSNPEYVGQIGTTCIATMADAGHAPNALPQRATAIVNCRIFPGFSVDEIRDELLQVIDDPAATIRIKWRPTVTDASPLREDVMDAVTDAVHARFRGLTIIPAMSAYGTDCVPFRALHVPCYGTSGLFIRLSDIFAHGLNERVPVAAIPGSLAHWDSVIRALTN